jgi:hypothetical protein
LIILGDGGDGFGVLGGVSSGVASERGRWVEELLSELVQEA